MQINNSRKKIWAVIILIGAYFLFTKVADWTMAYEYNNIDDYVVIPGSYNRVLSDSLQNALLHTEFEVAEVTAKVYDSVEGSSYHYIELSFKLKKNYLKDAKTEKRMRHSILNTIFEMFPPDLYTGKIKFEYAHLSYKKSIIVPLDYNQIKYNI